MNFLSENAIGTRGEAEPKAGRGAHIYIPPPLFTSASAPPFPTLPLPSISTLSSANLVDHTRRDNNNNNNRSASVRSAKRSGTSAGFREALSDEAKRRRVEFYNEFPPRSEIDKSAFVFNLATWVASQHGIHLADPITAKRVPARLPPKMVPYDLIPDVFSSAGLREIFKLPTLQLALPPRNDDAMDIDGENDVQIVCDAIGTQSQAIYMGLVFAMANVICVVDKALSLKCCECGVDATCGTLLTLAGEFTPKCFHSQAMDANVCWALNNQGHDLYTSMPSQASKDGRVGEAICLACLYSSVILHDRALMNNIGVWHSMEASYYENVMELPNQPFMRFCACHHPTIPGAMCLFRFSRVLGPNFIHITKFTTEVTIPMMLSELARDPAEFSYGFDTVTSGSFMSKYLVGVTHFGSIMETVSGRSPSLAFLSNFPSLPAAVAAVPLQTQSSPISSSSPLPSASIPRVSSPQSSPRKRVGKSLATDENVTKLTVTTAVVEAAAAVPNLPSETDLNKMTLDEKAVLLRQYLPAVKQFYTLLDDFATPLQLIVGQEDPTQELDYCRSCGVHGHPQIKTCPYATNRKVASKNGTRAAHFAFNVERFIKNAVTVTRHEQKNNSRDAEHCVELVERSLQRRHEGIPAMRGGPPESFIGHDPSVDKRSKRTPAPVLTPIVPFRTLAAVPEDRITTFLELSFFVDVDYLTSVIDTLTKGGYAVADLYDIKAWCDEVHRAYALMVASVSPNMVTFENFFETNQDNIAKSLWHFFKRRLQLVDFLKLPIGDERQLIDQMRTTEHPTLSGFQLEPMPAMMSQQQQHLPVKPQQQTRQRFDAVQEASHASAFTQNNNSRTLQDDIELLDDLELSLEHLSEDNVFHRLNK